MFHPEGPSLAELCAQALSSTRGGYDRLAPKFDYTPFRTPDELIVAIRPLVQERSVRRVLDLCCGTGAVFERLAGERLERIGIDFSQGMLRRARHKLRGQPAEPRWIQADALHLPFREAFDLVTCFGALGHFRRREQAALFSGIHRILVPGGRLVFPSFRMPGLSSPSLWLSRGFNAVMHFRNLLFPQEFVMFYLSTCLERMETLLPEMGYELDVREGLFAEPFERMLVVSAAKRARN